MLKVLLIDDEESVRNGLKKYISWDSLGIDMVFAAGTAEEALAFVQQEKPDIIISDIRMPRLNGIELGEKIRELHADCRIIFLSGYADKEYLKGAIHLSAEEYIEKPVDITVMEECLKGVVQKCKGDRESRRKEKELDWYRNSVYYPGSSEFEPEVPEELFEEMNSALMKKAEYHDTVRRILAYVNTHFKESEMSIKEIADAVYIAPTYLSSFFKAKTGETIGQYIKEVRIRYAVYLLEQRQYQVLEVSEKCGYADPNYFAKAFKKETGMSPSDYREQVKRKVGKDEKENSD